MNWAGIRVSELVTIDLEDINLNEGCIKIRSAKGGRERVVPVGSLVHKSLWKYINSFRPQPVTKQITRLFLSDKGLPLTRSGYPADAKTVWSESRSNYRQMLTSYLSSHFCQEISTQWR